MAENTENKTTLRQTALAMEKARTGVILTGKIEGGKVILDDECLKSIAREHPDATVSFVAVNAPFDPVSA